MSLLLTLLIFAVLALVAWALGHERKQELRRTALALDLRYEEGGWLKAGPRLHGFFDGVEVLREPYVVSTGKSSQRFTRYVALGVPPAVTVKQEGLGQRLLKVFGAEDQLVGDPVFDARFVLKGDPVWTTAALPAAARLALGRGTLADGALWVEDGRVVLQKPGDATQLAEVRAGLEVVTAVAAAMRVEPGGLVDRLAEVAHADGEAGVRARALAVLAQVDAARAAPVLRAALADPDPSVRVRAALALGERVAIRGLLADPALWPAHRAALFAGAPDEADRPELVGLLGHEDPEVVGSAVAALARVGGREDVSALRGVADRGGENGRRAEGAIAAIQARLGPVDAGRLSLAEERGLEGAVSEVGAQGAVSLAERVVKVRPTGR